MAVNDPFLKQLELWLRRSIIVLLGKLVRRKKPLPDNFNFASAKYLFIRQDRIGDVLVSTPLFSLLKKTYPQATIDVLLSTNNHFVLENNPHIRKRWVYTKGLMDTIRLLRSIRKESYDFAVDLIDNPSATSTLLCLFVGAQWTVGLEKENKYVYDITLPRLSRKNVHIVERLAELLKAFDITPQPEQLKIEYIPQEASRHFAADFYNTIRQNNRRIIGINISAGGRVRFWGIENFRSLITFLNAEYPEYDVLLLYSPSHESLAKEIVSGLDTVILAPRTETFDQFAALLECLAFLITPDTSAVHLAAAFGVPSVVLYVQSDKNLRIWDPYRTLCVPVVTTVDNLQTITVGEVKEAFQKLVSLASV